MGNWVYIFIYIIYNIYIYINRNTYWPVSYQNKQMGLLGPDPGPLVVLPFNSKSMLPAFGSQQIVCLLVEATALPLPVQQLRPLAGREFSGPSWPIGTVSIMIRVLGIKLPRRSLACQMPMSGAMMMTPTRRAQVNWRNSWGSISIASLTTIGGMGER